MAVMENVPDYPTPWSAHSGQLFDATGGFVCEMPSDAIATEVARRVNEGDRPCPLDDVVETTGGYVKRFDPAWVGLRVIVKGSDPWSLPEGVVGTVERFDNTDDKLPYRVRSAGGRSGWVHDVKPVSDRIFDVKPGDEVYVLSPVKGEAPERGVVEHVDFDDQILPFYVRFPHKADKPGEDFEWVHSVQVVRP